MNVILSFEQKIIVIKFFLNKLMWKTVIFFLFSQDIGLNKTTFYISSYKYGRTGSYIFISVR